MEKIKWGILGVGFIADVFATDLALVEGCELVAVASRSQERADVFAKKHNIQRAYNQYEALVNDPEVDAVYIATHNHVHKQQSIMCLKAGKAVLCEKPMALNYEEVLAVVETSKETSKLFMEGHWTRFKPTTKKLRELVETGVLGELRYISSDFGYQSEDDVDPKDRRLDKAIGGGALYDVGVYPLAMDNMLFDRWPDSITSQQIIGATGVDLQSKACFVYEQAMTDVHCAINAKTPWYTFVSGTKGNVGIDDPWFGNSMVITDNQGISQVFEFDNWGKNYTFEIEAFNQAFRQGKTEVAEITHQNSLDIMKMVDYIHRH